MGAGNSQSIHANIKGNVNAPSSAPCATSFHTVPVSTVTVANATCSPVCLFYKMEKMKICDLIQGTNLILCDGVRSILIEPARHVQCPVFEDLYVTGFHVIPNQPFDCPSGKPLFENFLTENASGEHKSCIISACGEVKFAKKGEIWVDQSGKDLKPSVL